MTTLSNKQKQAVAYVRVSTVRQGKSGVGLNGQLAAINAYADVTSTTIVEAFSDVATGVGPSSVRDRSGLQQALANARALGVPIIVNGLDRLARHSSSLEKLFREGSVTIISTDDGALVDPLVLVSRAARAQSEGEAIAERTRKALQKKKADGYRLGNPTNLDVAQANGRNSNMLRARSIVDRIADILIESPVHLNAPTVVRILNDRAIKTRRGGVWTTGAIRRPLGAARKIAERASSPSEIDDDQTRMEAHPNFGRFA